MISLYAELLSNIRQVSVVASLPSPSDVSTKAEIAPDGTSILVQHQGHREILSLPASVSLPRAPSLPVSHAVRHLTWRLPARASGSSVPSRIADNDAIPWSSIDLKPQSHLRCRQCQHDIVKEGTIHVWKDLPSENWAEMMEFWHCHKPLDHGQTEDGKLTNRGYGASNQISAQAGVGFVDLTSFMFAESDCHDLKFSISSVDTGTEASSLKEEDNHARKLLHVFCRCQTEVGMYSVLTSSISFHKWKVSCNTVSQGSAPTSTQCLAATLTASISRSGSAKTVIMPSVSSEHDQSQLAENTQVLYLWVLNPHIVYASSATRHIQSAMKVLYQEISLGEASKVIESLSSDVQDISLPTSAIIEARDTLGSTSSLLPERDRSFKEWHVGLLNRWEAKTPDNANHP